MNKWDRFEMILKDYSLDGLLKIIYVELSEQEVRDHSTKLSILECCER